mgnify:CR=1 FL=1|tara:strand:- start:14 stop:445 length:432 start_codon:yes stop_codon:yes gene_type:complete
MTTTQTKLTLQETYDWIEQERQTTWNLATMEATDWFPREHQEYQCELRSIACEVLRLHLEENPEDQDTLLDDIDIYERLHEIVDSSLVYIISQLKVIRWTDNEGSVDEEVGLDCEDSQSAITQIAYWAKIADVQDTLNLYSKR